MMQRVALSGPLAGLARGYLRQERPCSTRGGSTTRAWSPRAGYLLVFGAMTPEQLGKMDSGTGLGRMLAARARGLLGDGPPAGRPGRDHGHARLVPARRLQAVYPRGPGPGPRPRRPRRGLHRQRPALHPRAVHRGRLQAALLPRTIPTIPGLELACRYVPAQTAANVGGDWFDVIPLPGDRCAVTVGDVTGHDIRAAAVMGQLRTATHTLATLDLTPAETLTRLDQLTAGLTDEETSATCIYAVHDPATADWDIARAGHPLPALARPGQPAVFLDCPPACPSASASAAGTTSPPACTCRGAPPWSCTPTGASKPRRRYKYRNGAPGRHPHDHQLPAGQPGLRRPAGRAGPAPGRRHRRPHGPDLTTTGPDSSSARPLTPAPGSA